MKVIRIQVINGIDEFEAVERDGEVVVTSKGGLNNQSSIDDIVVMAALSVARGAIEK